MFNAWKWAGWIGKTVAAGLIMAFLSIWTAGYIVNSYAEALLKQFNIPMEQQPFALSGVWGKLWGADGGDSLASAGNEGSTGNESSTGGAGSDNGAVAQGSGSGAGSGTGTGTGAGTGTGTGASGDGNEVASGGVGDETGEYGGDGGQGAGGYSGGGGALEVLGGIDEEPEAASEEDSGTNSLLEALGEQQQGQQSEGGSPGIGAGNTGTGTELAMTTEEIAEAKGQINEEDKQRLFVMLMSKIPAEEWQIISRYMENGLTEQELSSIQQIVAKYLDQGQYDELMGILKKY